MHSTGPIKITLIVVLLMFCCTNVGWTQNQHRALPAPSYTIIKSDHTLDANGIAAIRKSIPQTFKTFLSNKLGQQIEVCLLYTSPSPRDRTRSRMPSSA